MKFNSNEKISHFNISFESAIDPAILYAHKWYEISLILIDKERVVCYNKIARNFQLSMPSRLWIMEYIL